MDMIRIRNPLGVYKPQPIDDFQRACAATGSIRGGNMDKVNIRAASRDISEKTFSEAIAKKLRACVNEPVPASRVVELEQAVQEKRYKIDADAIAQKILLCKGDCFS